MKIDSDYIFELEYKRGTPVKLPIPARPIYAGHFSGDDENSALLGSFVDRWHDEHDSFQIGRAHV